MKHEKKNDSTGLNEPEIYFVWNYTEWGGVQIYFLGLMRGISQNYTVKAVLPKDSGQKIIDYLTGNNIEYEFFAGKTDNSEAKSPRRKIERRWNDILTNLSLARHFSKKDLKGSIIQIDVAPWSGFFLLLYLVCKTNVFVTFHTRLPEFAPLRKFLLKIKFAVLSAFGTFHLAASNFDVKKSLRRYVNDRQFEEIEVIYSSINAGEIKNAVKENKSRSELAEEYGLPAEKIWVCNVAQFIERKGCWVLLEAIKILQSQRSDLYFVWLGTSSLDSETIEKISGYKVKNDFKFIAADEIGETRGDLLTLWNATDIFVLPSLQEGLPMSLVEAMALGKPCIASDINAIPEAVKDLETGILVEAGDANALARAISELADNPILRKSLGENARRTVFENFEETITSRKMIRLYENSIQGV